MLLSFKAMEIKFPRYIKLESTSSYMDGTKHLFREYGNKGLQTKIITPP